MRLSPLVVAAAVLCTASVAAHATPVTYNITFNATGQITASGSYLLTFDPTLAYANETAGLTVVSFSDTLTPPQVVGFTYDPQTAFLLIGGTISGVNTVESGTDDYALILADFPSDLASAGLLATSSALSGEIFEDSAGSVQISQPISVTPEPSSLVLLGTGLLGGIALVRRRLA